MPAFETICIDLPAHWLSPLINGDLTGLSDTEAIMFQRWLADTAGDVAHGRMFHVGDVSDETFFARYHDAVEYGMLACDCITVDLMVERAVGLTVGSTDTTGARRDALGSAR